MTWRQITGALIIATVTVLIGYDVFVIVTAGKDASISQVVIDAAYETPVIAFAAGLLCGHLFWRMPDRPKS